MKYHFIAIGGSAMHNLAIALKKKGYEITGSDDEIFEPSRSRLANYGILPEKTGWFPDKITSQLDGIIIGMHAREDNPELLKAKELGIRMFSFPEFLYEQSKAKTRVVIGGSHGKTTITAMIIHVLQAAGIEADYMVGAQLEGFEVMVKITEEASIMILEGDEYLTSPLDRRPKFHVYKPDIGLISGIAWDHINVFPTFENYVGQFRIFSNLISPNGYLIYFEGDKEVIKVASEAGKDINTIPYNVPDFSIDDGITYWKTKGKSIPLEIFGEHNLANANGAFNVCKVLGINEAVFFNAIKSFSGGSKRLELVCKNEFSAVFKDFAHAPSKLLATTKAVKQQYPDRKLVACIELHTYSSLNEKFLDQYRDTMKFVDLPIVYYSPHALEIKRMPPIPAEKIRNSFNHNSLQVLTNSQDLVNELISIDWKDKNLLMMSSGNFNNTDIKDLGQKIIKK